MQHFELRLLFKMLPPGPLENKCGRRNRGKSLTPSRACWSDSRAQEHVGNSLGAIGLGSLTTSWRKRRDWAMANPFLKLVAIGNYGRSDLEDRFA